jgi:serine/threonine-protein kinase
VSKIEWGAKYHNDIDAIHVKLEELYKSVMLEKNIPANNLVARCFINGSYYFSKQPTFPVRLLKEFIDLLRSCSREKSNLILVNLQTKLDTVARYTEVPAEDVPF